MDEWRDEHYPHHAHQFITLRGQTFFGHPSEQKWSRNEDYPLRYYLWKINRDAWLNLRDWRVPKDAVFGCVALLEELMADMAVDADAFEKEFVEGDLAGAASSPSVAQAWTHELDLFESWADSDYLTYELIDQWGNEFQIEPAWGMFDSAAALIHVTNAVEALDRKDYVSAGALAVRARDSHFAGLVERGAEVNEWLAKKMLARQGASAAHEENRRLRAQALTTYEAGSWPSKMQAARVISKQVNRTELVVLRWIREHTRQSGGA
jgi:hypothetical protein